MLTELAIIGVTLWVFQFRPEIEFDYTLPLPDKSNLAHTYTDEYLRAVVTLKTALEKNGS